MTPDLDPSPTGDRPFAGKVALVTGAAGGIGGAVASALVAAGAQVLAVDREAPETGGEDGCAAHHVADLTDQREAAEAVSVALERFGRMDILFNGHGISGRRFGDGPVDACTIEGWETVMAANLTSVFHVCKGAIPALRAAGGGAVVNLGSVLGLVGGDADFATHAYAASKGAIISLTRAMAITYAPDGISCNARG